jgi:hypothetical protein
MTLVLPSTYIKGQKLEVQSAPAKELDRGFTSPRDARYWRGLERFAQDAGDETLDLRLKQVKDAAINGKERTLNDSALVQDGLIPEHLLLAFDPVIRVNQSSITANSAVAYQAFGSDTGVDPRAKTRVNLGFDIAGQAARFCCGSDPTIVSANMTSSSTKRGDYHIGFELCESDIEEACYAGVFDIIGMFRAACELIAYNAIAQVNFWGDEQNKLRGLQQMNCPRMTLDKPLDLMTSKEVLEFMIFVQNYGEITSGESGIRKNAMLHSKGLDMVLAQDYESSNGTGCCDSLGMKLAERMLSAPIKRRYTDFMETIGVGGTPAAFVYARSNEYIRRDIGYFPVWDAPEYECKTLKFRMKWRIGEVTLLQPNAGLFISNFLSKGC